MLDVNTQQIDSVRASMRTLPNLLPYSRNWLPCDLVPVAPKPKLRLSRPMS